MHKRFVKYSFLITCAFILAGAGNLNAKSYDLLEYFPLIQGSKWVYNAKEKNSDTWQWQEKNVLEDYEELNSRKCIQMVYYEADYENNYEKDDYNLFAYDAEYIYLMGEREFEEDEDPGLHRFEPGLKIKRHMEVGESYKFNHMHIKPNGERIEEWVTFELLGVETVEVEAGTFSDCLKLRITEDSGYKEKMWWAKGVGEVKWEEISDPDETDQELDMSELAEYDVDGDDEVSNTVWFPKGVPFSPDHFAVYDKFDAESLDTYKWVAEDMQGQAVLESGSLLGKTQETEDSFFLQSRTQSRGWGFQFNKDDWQVEQGWSFEVGTSASRSSLREGQGSHYYNFDYTLEGGELYVKVERFEYNSEGETKEDSREILDKKKVEVANLSEINNKIFYVYFLHDLRKVQFYSSGLEQSNFKLIMDYDLQAINLENISNSGHLMLSLADSKTKIETVYNVPELDAEFVKEGEKCENCNLKKNERAEINLNSFFRGAEIPDWKKNKLYMRITDAPDEYGVDGYWLTTEGLAEEASPVFSEQIPRNSMNYNPFLIIEPGLFEYNGEYSFSFYASSKAKYCWGLDSVSFTYGNAEQADSGIKYGNFAVTVKEYQNNSDWEQKIKEVFGPEYRVADWNDLKEFYNSGGDLLDLFDGLNLSKGESAFVKRSGEKQFSSTRYYFATRHEHDKSSSYLAHENIDNYLISLGSWYGSNQILAVKKEVEF